MSLFYYIIPTESFPHFHTSSGIRVAAALDGAATGDGCRVWKCRLVENHTPGFPQVLENSYPFLLTSKLHYDKETIGILEKLYNHPSVVHYCGGNEFSYVRNREMVDRIGRIVKRRGGGRAFKASSPTSGEGHNWKVFHGIANINDYKKDDSAFLSEFGMQAVPDRESLDKFIPKKHQWPVAPRMPYAAIELTYVRSEQMHHLRRFIPRDRELENAEYWTYHDAHLFKLFRYAKQIGFSDVDSFIEATQKMQAYGLQTAVEHIRRRRFNASGVMFWQFNEPWPTISWSVVDYYLKPKLAYEKIRQIYSPVLLSLDFAHRPYKPGCSLRIKPYLINDLNVKYIGVKCKVSLLDAEDSELDGKEFKISSVQPDSIMPLDPFSFSLERSGCKLVCDVIHGGRSISHNEYDLSVCDTKPTNNVLIAANWLMNNLMWI